MSEGGWGAWSVAYPGATVATVSASDALVERVVKLLPGDRFRVECADRDRERVALMLRQLADKIAGVS